MLHVCIKDLYSFPADEFERDPFENLREIKNKYLICKKGNQYTITDNPQYAGKIPGYRRRDKCIIEPTETTNPWYGHGFELSNHRVLEHFKPI